MANGSLYWLDASETPLNRLSLADEVYTPLVVKWPIPEDAISDGSHVYWVSGNRLFKSAVDRTTTIVLDEGARTGTEDARAAIAIDDRHVYWINTISEESCSTPCAHAIRQVAKAGGAATTLATGTRRSIIVALVVADGQVFWEEEGIGPASDDGSIGSKIRKMNLADRTVTELVNGRLNGLMPPPPPNHIAGTWQPVGGIEVDASSVYFAVVDFDSYQLIRVPVAGGELTVMADIAADASVSVRDLAQDSGSLFWIDGSSLRSMPKAGGVPVQLAGGLDSPLSLAHANGNLYWLESACCAHGQQGTIKKIASFGGMPVVLKAGAAAPTSLSVDALSVYWVEGGSIGSIEGFGRISRIGQDGTGETVLMESAGGGPFAVDGTSVYFANAFTIKKVSIDGGPVTRLAIGDFHVADIATDGIDVYWLDALGLVFKVPVNGGPVVWLAAGSGGPGGTLRLDATHVYWLDHGDTVLRVPKEGGGAAAMIGPVTGFMTDFVVEGGVVYYSEWDGGRIRKVPATGGVPSTLASPGTDQTRRLTTDGTAVYWIDQMFVGKVGVDGTNAEFVIGDVVSDPFISNGIVTDETSLYWTEAAGNLVVRATPK